MPFKGDVQLMSAIKLIFINHNSISHWSRRKNVVHNEQRFHWHGDSKTFIERIDKFKKTQDFPQKKAYS